MARSTKDLIISLMRKLDLLHTKYVHVWVNNQFFENGYYGNLGGFWEWYVDELKRRNILINPIQSNDRFGINNGEYLADGNIHRQG